MKTWADKVFDCRADVYVHNVHCKHHGECFNICFTSDMSSGIFRMQRRRIRTEVGLSSAILSFCK